MSRAPLKRRTLRRGCAIAGGLLLSAATVSACSGAQDAGTTSGSAAPVVPSTQAPGSAPAATTGVGEPSATTSDSGTIKSSDDAGDATSSGGDPLLPQGQVLVANEDGVTLLATRGTGGVVVEDSAVRAFDDGRGGLVYQSAAPEGAGGILWQQSVDSEPVEVVEPGLADQVELEGAAVVEGQPTVVFSVAVVGERPDDYEESIQSVRLPSGDRRRVDFTGGFESGLSGATLAATGVMSLQTFDTAATVFRFVDLTGRDVAVPANPLADGACGDEPDCPTGLTLGLSGDRAAWLQAEPVEGGARYDLVVQGVEADEPSTVVPIDAALLPDGVLPSTVELAGDLALVNRGSTDGPNPPVASALIVDLTSDEVTELPEAGYASLTRPGSPNR
ncbi:hypothetical protein [Jannaschia sp. R86511]|uniref:hypothetical protein n=1 Tax=Jannaschia sp. R86511 TaxID=3093853 RepID=UPI0036D277CC